MTNFERITESLETLAGILSGHCDACDMCVKNGICEEGWEDCVEGISEWLKQQEESRIVNNFKIIYNR